MMLRGNIGKQGSVFFAEAESESSTPEELQNAKLLVDENLIVAANLKTLEKLQKKFVTNRQEKNCQITKL